MAASVANCIHMAVISYAAGLRDLKASSKLQQLLMLCGLMR